MLELEMLMLAVIKEGRQNKFISKVLLNQSEAV